LMFATRDIKNTIDAEIKAKTKSQTSTLDNVSIMLYSLKKNDLDFKLVQKINDFYQGTDKQTFVSHLISSVADLTRIFSDIDTIAEPVNYPVYFRSKLSGNEGLFKLLDIDLESHIKDMLFDDANCEIRL
jgi:hypothetical protein